MRNRTESKGNRSQQSDNEQSKEDSKQSTLSFNPNSHEKLDQGLQGLHYTLYQIYTGHDNKLRTMISTTSALNIKQIFTGTSIFTTEETCSLFLAKTNHIEMFHQITQNRHSIHPLFDTTNNNWDMGTTNVQSSSIDKSTFLNVKVAKEGEAAFVHLTTNSGLEFDVRKLYFLIDFANSQSTDV